MSKNILIPFLPELDELPIEEVCGVMESQALRQSIGAINWSSEYSYRPITVFDIARSNEYLFFNFFVRGNCLVALHSQPNSPVWNDSCVAIYASLPNDRYIALNFNCIGTCHAAIYSSQKTTLLTQEAISTIKVCPSVGKRQFQEMQGLFAWELTVAIPYTILELDRNNLPESIGMNLYKRADSSSLPHFLSWNPINSDKIDFDRPDCFGIVKL